MQFHNERPTNDPKAFRRKPKQLDQAPTLFRRGSGTIMIGGDGDVAEQLDMPGFQGVATTAEIGSVKPLEEVFEDTEPDPKVRALVRRIAQQLAVRRTVRPDAARRGSGKPVSLRYRGDADEIDVERTLEVLVERPFPDPEDIFVRTRIRTKRAVTLVVDVSGSMKGEKAAVAAATVGALAGELVGEELSVVAFWKDCALLASGRHRVNASAVLDDLLRLPSRGLTNVNVGLSQAAVELAASSARERIVILLSDCVHNAGPDPLEVARRLPKLHVMLQVDGEHDEWLGRELARIGGGRLAPVRNYRDVAPALNRLLQP